MGILDKMKDLSGSANDLFDETGNALLTGKSVGIVRRFCGATDDFEDSETPPPPPVPAREVRMSVNVGVNGRSYGPYDRDALLGMIETGWLTPDTQVFMPGMSGWLPARQVPDVFALFDINTAVPPIPPVPPTNSEDYSCACTESGAQEENILSPRLDRLVTAAVADGEISDMERQVLIRNAQEEGVAMDEFVMILEARLYEQRSMLTKQQKEMEHKQLMVKAKMQAEAAQAMAISRQHETTVREKTKCPHCGAIRKPLATICHECGHEYISATMTAWEILCAKIDKVIEKQSKTLNPFKWDTTDEQIVNLINGAAVPNTTDEMVEFFTACAPLAKKESFWSDASDIEDAYYKKAQQLLIKARIVMKDNPETLAELEAIAKQYKIKA